TFTGFLRTHLLHSPFVLLKALTRSFAKTVVLCRRCDTQPTLRLGSADLITQLIQFSIRVNRMVMRFPSSHVAYQKLNREQGG
ncbi:MAG: hypothetical protein ACON4H_13850, partial [Rubripirellula sp.]